MQPTATAPSSDPPEAPDRVAFVALYRRYADAVYRYHVRHVGDHDEAEDLTAATFDRALAAFDRYREQGSAAAWLFAIARHARLDHQRRLRPRVGLAQAGSVADAAPSPDERALRAEAARELRQLVAALPADQQEALALRFFAGLSTAEAAAALGRSEGAVKMLVHRAVAALRGSYAAEEEP
jgi:RNA polymerase sigma-70 factor (ECF subfamily)